RHLECLERRRQFHHRHGRIDGSGAVLVPPGAQPASAVRRACRRRPKKAEKRFVNRLFLLPIHPGRGGAGRRRSVGGLMNLASAKAALKNGLKAALYHTGLAGLMARRTSRDALTIVMFHRVLPHHDPRSKSADPDYTVDLAVFESFLG